MIWSVGKGALVVKAGRLGQEEWNLAAIELELTSSTRGKKAKREWVLFARARGPRTK